MLYAILGMVTMSILNACKNNQNEPEEDDNGGSNASAVYYIKHSWGGNGWSWQKMRSQGDGTYTYSGEWGGVGANINSSKSDDGAKWFSEDEIDGAAGLQEGDYITFVYDADENELYISGSSSGGGGNEDTKSYYIKHPWGGGSWNWQQMSKAGNGFTCTGVWGGTGANINTSASDSGSEWYEASKISGASSVSVGTTVTFTFYPTNGSIGTLSVSANGGGGNPGGGDNPGGGGTEQPIPSAPTNLTAVQAGPKAYAYVSLLWDYNSSADHYVIYRSTSKNSGYSKIGTNYASSYSDENIADKKTYYYKVTAANSSGKESDYSNIASVTIDKTIVEAPAPPTIKTAKASNNNTAVTITWDYVVNGTHSAPTEVSLVSDYQETVKGSLILFDWTTASSKKTATIKVSDFVANDVRYDYSMVLKVKNSAGESSVTITWKPREAILDVRGSQNKTFNL